MIIYCIVMYISGFREHQCQRSLVPIMNDFWWLWYPFSWHLPYSWGKTPEKPKNLPNWESNPGLLHDRCACYHLAHSSGPATEARDHHHPPLDKQWLWVIHHNHHHHDSCPLNTYAYVHQHWLRLISFIVD